MRLLGLSAVFMTLVNCGASAQGQFENCSGPNLDIRIAACSALIQAHPENVSDFSSIYNNRGSGYAAKGELDQAILDYSQAIYLNSNFALAYSNRGAAYEALGRIELALQDYDKAIALAPDFRVAYNNRCYALAELGHPEEGLKDCDKAVTMRSDDAKSLDSRGFVYFRMARYDAAIKDLDDALKLDPAIPSALFVRGAAKLKLGDVGGQNDIERAKKLDKGILDAMTKLGVSP